MTTDRSVSVNGPQELSALAVFSAWLWVPHAQVRLRGLSTVRLAIFRNRFVVTPRWQADQLNRVLGIPARLDYTWPVAVIERLRPAGRTGVLLEVEKELGRASVGRLAQSSLDEAMSAAGFEVVRVTHWGWEAPRALGGEGRQIHGSQLPPSILAR